MFKFAFLWMSNLIVRSQWRFGNSNLVKKKPQPDRLGKQNIDRLNGNRFVRHVTCMSCMYVINYALMWSYMLVHKEMETHVHTNLEIPTLLQRRIHHWCLHRKQWQSSCNRRKTQIELQNQSIPGSSTNTVAGTVGKHIRFGYTQQLIARLNEYRRSAPQCNFEQTIQGEPLNPMARVSDNARLLGNAETHVLVQTGKGERWWGHDQGSDEGTGTAEKQLDELWP